MSSPVRKPLDDEIDIHGLTHVADQFLQDALDGGGTDNIKIVVVRTVPKEGR